MRDQNDFINLDGNKLSIDDIVAIGRSEKLVTLGPEIN